MSRFAAAAVIADLSREISSTAAAIAIGDRLGLPCSNALRSRLRDRKSTRLNSSHSQISYAVFCLKKKNNDTTYAFSQPLPEHHLLFLLDAIGQPIVQAALVTEL